MGLPGPAAPHAHAACAVDQTVHGDGNGLCAGRELVGLALGYAGTADHDAGVGLLRRVGDQLPASGIGQGNGGSGVLGLGELDHDGTLV